MSLHIYVLPLTAYFTGDYETIFEKLSDLAGGQGMLLTPEGLVRPQVASPDELELRKRRAEIGAWVSEFQRQIAQRFGVEASWDESGGLRFSTNMSYTSHGEMLTCAERGGALYTEAIREMSHASVYLPIPFAGTAEFVCPYSEERLRVASVFTWRQIIERLAGAIESTPEWSRLLANKEPVVSGDLAEISGARSTVRQWLESCGISIEQGVPIVTD